MRNERDRYPMSRVETDEIPKKTTNQSNEKPCESEKRCEPGKMSMWIAALCEKPLSC